MKALFATVFIVFQSTAWASTPLPSTARGLESMDNVHEVRSSRILRGSTPVGDQMQLLVNEGVTDILVFKKDKDGEVKSELQAFQNLGLQSASLNHIAAEWKIALPFRQTCEQYVQALTLIRDVEKSSDRRMYFHCTAGQDRTSLLAGLYQVLHGESPREVFEKEMCARGYEAGGGEQKPMTVVRAIRKNLTPFYLQMVRLIQTRGITIENLSNEICLTNDTVNFDFNQMTQWQCGANQK